MLANLTSPGAPFELVDATVRGTRCRVFKFAPRSLAELYPAARVHDSKVLAVLGDERVTYVEVFARAAGLAEHLRAAEGLQPGEFVGLALANSPDWLVAFIAVSALGAVPVLVNSRGAPDEMDHGLASTHCRLVVADARRALRLGAVHERLPGVRGVAIEDAADPLPAGWTRFDTKAALGEQSPAPVADRLPCVLAEPDAPAMVLFTSGTTGRAKGAVLSHRAVMTALWANQLSATMVGMRMAARYGMDLATLAARSPQACTLLVYPLFHTSGCHSVFLTNLLRGGRVVFMPRWSAEDALRLIAREKVTSLPGVPTMLWDLLHSPALTAADTSSLNNVSTGGQGLPANLVAAVQAAFPNVVMGTGYGLTETSGMVTLTVGEEFLENRHTAGKPVPTVEMRLVDEAGQAVAAGEPGEVCVRGASLFLGYCDGTGVDSSLDADGWFRTGDVGILDASGFLSIVDRRKDMVISAGENIYCAEVERALSMHPDVVEVAALGVPDERLGERLVAVVVPRAGSALAAGDLAGMLGPHVAAQLADYKVPREFRAVAETLPRNLMGKVLKAQLRQRLFGGAG